MKGLATAILELTGSKSKIVFQELPSDDPVRRCPDISRANAQLGWSPTVDLHDGLTKTIAYFDDLLLKDRKR
jgi:UDP-glucuronate decarboxylase